MRTRSGRPSGKIVGVGESADPVSVHLIPPVARTTLPRSAALRGKAVPAAAQMVDGPATFGTGGARSVNGARVQPAGGSGTRAVRVAAGKVQGGRAAAIRTDSVDEGANRAAGCRYATGR